MNERVVAGRYRVLSDIAAGGMGSVHEAEHVVSKKRVALKLLFAHGAKDEASRERFLREASAPAQIGHEGIVEVYDAGIDDDGTLFVAMELLKGGTLRDRIDAGPIPLPELFSIFVRMLDPLAAAHARHIVHRDLKPENVFLVRKSSGVEILKILDFGIARDLDSQKSMTQTGVAMGTPHYMAPEQAMNARAVVAAADVWAVGAMLYEILTGIVPFDGETMSAVIVHVVTQAHRPILELRPDVPPQLAALVDRCLDKEPSRRPPDAGALLAELQNAAAAIGLAIPATLVTQTPVPTGANAYPTQQPSAPSMSGAPGATPAPQPGYGTAPQGFGTPPANAGYGTAPQGFGTPPANAGFGAPSQGFGAPAAQGYGTAPQGFGVPSSQGFGTPGSQPGFGAPPVHATPGSQPGYGAPAQGFGTPPAGSWSPPSQGFGTPTPPSKSGKGLFVGVALASLFGCLVCGGVAYKFSDAIGGATASATPVVDPSAVPTVTTTTTTVGATPPVTPPPVTPPPTTDAAGVQRFTGTLQTGDRTLQSGEFEDSYELQLAAGRRYRIRLVSDKMDTYLIVRSPSGKNQDNDDASEQDHNAQIDVEGEAGTTRIVATTFGVGESGDYVLTVEPLP